ncbi:MAG: lamin tail domain-containing protein, partial [Planctomycetes bacterium]|nr:lamin tail domain-containing protein [Planctomycetota bacterium]
MGYLRIQAILVASLLVLGPAGLVRAQVPAGSPGAATGVRGPFEISEFLAINDRGLDDEDRDEEDWIEIHNVSAGPASLAGWYLTDRADNLTQWKFPAVTLGPDGYLVVFASGKDRRDPAGTLHTNFRLSGTGEYLALVRPDGVTVASEYAPAFPVQAPDVSYGVSGATTEIVLLAPGAPAKALIPFSDALEQRVRPDAPRPWTHEELDDSYWLSGKTWVGFGYS